MPRGRFIPFLIPICAAAILAGSCSRGPEINAEIRALLDLDAPALAVELAAGRVSAEEIVTAAIERIAAIDDAGPQLNAIIEINPDAIDIARELDRRFVNNGPVGPLHGLPVVLKANIDTGDAMATSAGSLALVDHHAAADADLVARLRLAGAVILAKANLSEWANFRSTRSTSGWSSVGGQTRNAYVLDRNPCGSSSGSAVAVAARLVPLAVGTETDGSVVCPSAANGVVGIKPTQGLVSQAGIVPLAASQDTAGPIARTVAGAAMLLEAMQVRDGPLRAAESRRDLNGIRLGVIRDYSGEGSAPRVEALFSNWLESLEASGAELIDPIELNLPEGLGDAEYDVLLYEFKAGINEYLAAAGTEPGTLAALIEFNNDNAATVMPHFGQEIFELAAARGGLDETAYLEARRASQLTMRARLESVFAAYELDALVAPVNKPAWKTDWVNGDTFSLSSSSLAAVSGYPSIAVPAGLVSGLPVSMAFIGTPFSDARLVEIATVFERTVGPIPPPSFVTSLESSGAYR